jgi:hypothetical protein
MDGAAARGRPTRQGAYDITYGEEDEVRARLEAEGYRVVSQDVPLRRNPSLLARAKRALFGRGKSKRRAPAQPAGRSNLKLPRGKVAGKISLAEAIRRNVPGIREAVARFKKFHGCAPSGDVTLYDDGRKDNAAGFIMGRIPAYDYVVDKSLVPGSNKNKGPWRHAASTKNPSYYAHIPSSGQTVVVGATKVTDWMRETDDTDRRH